MVEWLRILFGKKKVEKRVSKEPAAQAKEQSGGSAERWHAFLLDEEFLRQLKERMGIRSADHVSLFNVAMSFLEWAVVVVEDGRIVASVDEVRAKYKELKMSWAEYPLRLARVRNLLEDGLEDDLAGASALDEDMLEYLTVMW